jgi:hypothetical protein
LADVSPHALIQSFIASLGEFMATLMPAVSRPTVQKTLWCASSTATITADRDCFIVGVAPLTLGAFVLANVPITVGAVSFANSTTYDVIAAFTSGSSLFANLPIRWFWAATQKIYLVSTVGMGIQLTIEYA